MSAGIGGLFERIARWREARADRRGPAPQGCRTHAALELDHARFWGLVVDALRAIGDPATPAPTVPTDAAALAATEQIA